MRTIVLTALTLALSPALARLPDQPQTQDAQPSAATPQPDEPLLSGPKVDIEPTGTTLVRHDIHGRLRRLDALPELAAVELLDLSDATRAKVDRIITERTALFDRFVIKSLDLFIELESADIAKDTFEQSRLLGVMFHRLEPLTRRGSLGREIAGVLPRDQRVRFRSLVRSYWTAVLDDERAMAENAGEKIGRLDIFRRETERQLRTAIEQSIERQTTALGIGIEIILQRLDLNTEQNAKVRELIEDAMDRNGGEASEDDQGLLMLKVLSVLDERQRAIAIRAIAGQ
jgi:hypothetical protein